jgi:hypothetical protein
MSQPNSAYGVGARTKYPRRDTTPPPQPQMPAPAMAPIPQLQQPEPPPQVAPVVQQAREALMAARAKANEAAGVAANPPPLPNTPAHNLIGFPLREVFHAYTPAGEDIVPIRLEIDGAALEPPVERRYTDTVLWNARDSNLTPEIFASVTVDEIGLPDAFAEPIATQIRQAIREHLTVPDAAAAAGAAAASPVAAAAATTSSTTAEKIVTLDLHVTHETGIELRDRVLWDVSRSDLTPEAFARGLCADLKLSELEGAVAFQVREQLKKIMAGGVVSGGGGEAKTEEAPPVDGEEVIRSERDALDWSPMVTNLKESAEVVEEKRKANEQEAERRDRMRKKAKSG